MTITYAQLKAKFERDLDLEDELFIQDTELMEIFNDGIREAEGVIHKLGIEEIYFLEYDNPAVVSGTAEYTMPTTIYANKFVKCIYNDGNRVFPIKENKGKYKFETIAINNNTQFSQPIYRYYIRNSYTNHTTMSVKWGLTPTPTETSSTRFTRWFIRKANVLSATTSVCDLPDACLNFLYAYAAWRVWGKEGDGRATEAEKEKDMQKQSMIENLSDMTPDEENEVEMDISTYEDMS